MANPLTGDFDIVAEFTINAANRVLAAMHSVERFPHAETFYVNDAEDRILGEIVLSVVDKHGQAIVGSPAISDQAHGTRASFLRPAGGPDRLVNDRPSHLDRIGERLEPSGLRGWAHLQLSAPTISLPDAAGLQATIHISMRAKFDAEDPATSPMPRFLRGEIRTTVTMDKVISQVGAQMDVSLEPHNVTVDFVPAWASASPSGPPVVLGEPEIRQVKRVIKNSILTGFQPYNVLLPESAGSLQFRALPGGPAIALLLGINSWDGDPASVSHVFLETADDFAMAASAEFIDASFNDFKEQLKAIRIIFKSTWADYDAWISTVKVELQNGQILVTGEGYAHTESNFDDFTFIVQQLLGLELVDAQGTMGGPICTAQPVIVGDLVLIAVGGIEAHVFNALKGDTVDLLRQRRNNMVDALKPTVRGIFNANSNIGGFLKELMEVPSKPGAPENPGVPPAVEPSLTYHSVEIIPSGVVLHGSLAMPEWPRIHVQFATTETEYSAQPSWIPGGTIQDFSWALQFAPPFATDANAFVLTRTAADAGRKMCVTVAGTRIPASGPVPSPLPRVSAQNCGWLQIPLTTRVESIGKPLPLVAATHLSPEGKTLIAAHTWPWVQDGAGVNLIVHFPDEGPVEQLDTLRHALLECGRSDAEAAILVVTDPDQFESAGGRNVIFTDDPNGAWRQLMDAKRRPATFLMTSAGAVVWSRYGKPSLRSLVEALRTYLLPSGGGLSQLLAAGIRVGQAPPNFIFETAPGRELILRKLIGQPVTLLFWKSTSRPCLEMLRQLEDRLATSRRGRHAVLAINDGEDAALATTVGVRHAPSAVIVTDPKRQISIAYGVNIWPTTVFVDALGSISDIQYGILPPEPRREPAEPKRRPDEPQRPPEKRGRPLRGRPTAK